MIEFHWRKYWRTFPLKWPPQPGFWFGASPRQTLVEVLAVQSPIFLWAILFAPHMPIGPLTRLSGAFLTIAGPGCILYSVFRLQRSVRPWRQRLVFSVVIGAIVGFVPSVVLVIIWDTHAGEAVRALRVPSVPFSLAWLAAFIGSWIVSRLSARLLVYWNGLRRRRLVWALTNAHLMVVVLGSGLICTLVVVVEVLTSQNVPFQLLPILFFIFLLTIIVVLVVLPPSALFSYVFAHRTTRRLEALADATDTLRAGDYSIRVPVRGEDEVAQLQANFNAMAADLERAVHELQAERDTVATLLKARRELVASVSHELRTPVATLRGYLESTRTHWDGTRTPPDTLRHDVEIMERETLHLQALIDDLFTLSRAEVGRLELRPAPTDVGTVARRCAETFAPLAWQSNRVEVVANVPEDVPLALVDASRLEQAVQNLLHNGVRHTPPGGIVAVEVDTELESDAPTDAVVVRVKDTGEGIAPDELTHIWERFYRTERARQRPNSGTGLGLALVKELIEAMGGSVAVESELGEGSCFTLRLPHAHIDRTAALRSIEEAAGAPDNARNPASRLRVS